MKSPRLVICGDSHSLTLLFTHWALKQGFARVTGVTEKTVQSYVEDPGTIVVWLRSMPAHDFSIPGQADPFRDSANVTLCCTEEIGLRELQISQFLSALKAEEISATETGQVWRYSLSRPRPAAELALAGTAS